jgi:LPS sulfotransferase NodH
MNEGLSSQNIKLQAHACVICTAPRTGSYLLSEGLEGTGILGAPSEYFRGREDLADWWVERLGIKNNAEYVDKVIARGTTPNGVFGLKLMWFQVPDLIERFRAAGHHLPPSADFDDYLHRRFGTVTYLWLRRRDTVAQAISWYRAAQSNVWHVRPGGAAQPSGVHKDPPFDIGEIDRFVGMVEDYDRQWRAFFTRKKIKALVLIYEDFVSSREKYERTIRAICKFAGFAPEGLPVRGPSYEQQADAISLEWAQEYRRIKGSVTAASGQSSVRVPVVVNQGKPPRAASAARRKLASKAPSRAEPLAEPTAALSLTAYETPLNLNVDLGIAIATAPSRRPWMDATHNRFAYRCLPLVIANQHGWLLLNPCRVKVRWTGGDSLDSLEIKYPSGEKRRIASSHFGAGILTFAINYVFRTPPGYNLLVRGPSNMPKDGIYPLDGIVETDWSEATFTMNWKMTRPGHEICFERHEPFAMLSPVARGELERFRPEIFSMSDNPGLEAGYRDWARARSIFRKEKAVAGSEAQKAKWQRHYMRGETVSERTAPEHQTALSLREFIDKRR